VGGGEGAFYKGEGGGGERETIPPNITESSTDRQWNTVTLSEESTFCSENDEAVLLYRPRRQRHNTHYVSAHCYSMLHTT